MIGLEIERLLLYALKSGLIVPADTVLMRNLLLDLLGEPLPYEGAAEPPERGTDVIERICAYAVESGLAEDADAFGARLMGILTPRQSQVNDRFAELYASSPKAATDWFYGFSKATNYIRTAELARNLYWRAETEFGGLEITVNLSKPEKDPRQIALAGSTPQTGYPKCLLCMQNVGFAGNPNHPARQNHRLIPLSLGGREWYFQYSPYVYYNEHCIVLNAEHTPMKLGDGTFYMLLEFIRKFPHYFIGSNADLPIVGGSILAHDHFQGGRHVFPMELAAIERGFAHHEYPGLTVGVLKWPVSALRISGESADAVAELAARIYNAWTGYSDGADILAYSPTGEPHNTVTPIARKRGGLYEMDLALRNNRTSAEHPLGIFHPHADVHHIKKENIGLIEVMGLAILPGRLERELALIERVLCGERLDDEALAKHADWIAVLAAENGCAMSAAAAKALLRNEVGKKFTRVLTDAGVFKRGTDGMARFLESAGLVSLNCDAVRPWLCKDKG